MLGKLYIIGTPIGNLGDITYRAVQTLKDVDFIAAEDTRVSGKLLNYLDIKKPMISYYEHNIRKRGEEIISRILNGENCALISDAGMPAISDPGEDLVVLAAQHNIEIISIPGACAAISALSISGLSTNRFAFDGFIANSGKNRFLHLETLKTETRTIILYEAPHKLCKTLDDLLYHFGDRNISLAREITKIHEEVLRMTIATAIEFYKTTKPRGEYVLVIEGYIPEIIEISDDTLLKNVAIFIEDGMSLRDAVKRVCEKFGASKNSLYNLATEFFKKN